MINLIGLAIATLDASDVQVELLLLEPQQAPCVVLPRKDMACLISLDISTTYCNFEFENSEAVTRVCTNGLCSLVVPVPFVVQSNGEQRERERDLMSARNERINRSQHGSMLSIVYLETNKNRKTRGPILR